MANLRRDETRDERREMRETRRETRHNNSPPTKKLRLRLGWGRGGVWVKVGLGWVGVVQYQEEFC